MQGDEEENSSGMPFRCCSHLTTVSARRKKCKIAVLPYGKKKKKPRGMDSPLCEFHLHLVCNSLWHIPFYPCQFGFFAHLCAPIRPITCTQYAPDNGTNRDVYARFVYLDSDSAASKGLRVAPIVANIGLLSLWFLYRFNDVDDQFFAGSIQF